MKCPSCQREFLRNGSIDDVARIAAEKSQDAPVSIYCFLCFAELKLTAICDEGGPEWELRTA